MPSQLLIGVAHVCSNSSHILLLKLGIQTNPIRASDGFVFLSHRSRGRLLLLLPDFYVLPANKPQASSLSKAKFLHWRPSPSCDQREAQSVRQLGEQKAFRKPVTKSNSRPKVQLSEYDSIPLLILLLMALENVFEISGGGSRPCVYV